MPQDLDSLLARFLPTSAAAAVFITANSRIASSVQPNLRRFCARILRYLETRQPTIPGSAGEYHLMDLDGQKLLLVSSLLNQSLPVSLLFPTDTSFDAILNAFSTLEALLNVPELPELNDLKPRKNSPSAAQRWQDALFETPSACPTEANLPTQVESQPDAVSEPASDGWRLIF